MKKNQYACILMIMAAAMVTHSIDSSAQAQTQVESTQELKLDAGKPVAVGIGTKVATTLHFPSEITGLFGYGLTDGRAPGTYHYHHPDGSGVLSLRCLAPDKEAFVTVMLGDKAYALQLRATEHPAVIIRLREPSEKNDKRALLAKPISKEEITERRLDYSTERLLNFLKLGKNAHILRHSLPKLYEGAQSRKVDSRYDDGEVSTVIRDIIRFPQEDTFTFIVEIENRRDDAIGYDPGSMQIKVGGRLYPVTVADASGFVEAKGKALAHVVLKGDTEGARAHLSIKNDFQLVIGAYAAYGELPALMTEYLEPVDEAELPPNDSPPSAGLLPLLPPLTNSASSISSTGRDSK